MEKYQFNITGMKSQQEHIIKNEKRRWNKGEAFCTQILIFKTYPHCMCSPRNIAEPYPHDTYMSAITRLTDDTSLMIPQSAT